MTIYLCGPVSGRPRQEAVDHFDKVRGGICRRADEARKLTICTCNPMYFCPSNLEWHKAMRVCIENLVKCDGIALLQGWQKSEGARLELDLAEDLHIPVVYVEPPIDDKGLEDLFLMIPETYRYHSARLRQFIKEGWTEEVAEERALAELIHRYLDPHGFEYINNSREE